MCLMWLNYFVIYQYDKKGLIIFYKIYSFDLKLFYSLWETTFTILFFHSTKVPSSIFWRATFTSQR